MKKFIIVIILIIMIILLAILNNNITKKDYNKCLENNSKSICNELKK